MSRTREITFIAVFLLCLKNILVYRPQTILFQDALQTANRTSAAVTSVSGGTPLAVDESSQKQTVQTWEGWHSVSKMAYEFWNGNPFCDRIQRLRRNDTSDAKTSIVLNITFDCQHLFQRSPLGTGNFLSIFYAARLAARVNGHVDVLLNCPDAEQHKSDLILPWFMGWFPSIIDSNTPMPEEVCISYNEGCPLGYMLPDMQFELRRMAVALVGVPHSNHPAAAFAQKYLWTESSNKNKYQVASPRKEQPPLIPNIELDESVLHFRCGDLMDTKHKGYGFMRFSAFARNLSPNTTSIGILTQPFENDDQHQQRYLDATAKRRRRCRKLAAAFVDYLKEKFPAARIRIHNSANETINLAFSRMIMANQAVAGISTFGVYPALATFGTGYIREPDFRKAQNLWLVSPHRLDNITDNVVLFREKDRLMTRKATQMWSQPNGEAKVIQWFRGEKSN